VVTAAKPDRLRTAACLVLAAALCVVAGRYAARAFDLSWRDYGEGPVLAMVERMRHEPVSRHWIARPPYTLTCYGPGYYATVLGVSQLMPWQGTVIPGRLVALAAALGITALVAGVVVRQTGRIEFGLFAGLLFLGSSVVSSWVPFHRVDTLAVLFAVAAYAAATSEKTRGLVAAAILIAAGSLVKQTAALAAVPIFVHLLLTRRFRPAAGFAAGVALLGAGLWLAVDALSGGYFLTLAVRGNVNRPAAGHGLRLALGFLQCHTALAGLLVAAWLVKNHTRTALGSLFFTAMVLGTLIAVPAAMKEGASINYFLEPCALAAVVVGVHGLPHLGAAMPRGLPIALGVLGLVLAIPGLGDFPATGDLPPAPSGLPPAVAEAADNPSRLHPDWVLADGPWVDTVLAAGDRPVVNDPFLFRLLVDNGTMRPDELLSAMAEGRIAWLYLARPIEAHGQAVGSELQRWPAPVIEGMHRLYAPVSKQQNACIYRKKVSGTFYEGG